MAVIVAAAPGSAWVLTGLLAADALVLGANCASNESKMTVVSAIASIPFSMGRTHCHFGPYFAWMIAKRDVTGAWTILPCATEDDYHQQSQLTYELPKTPDSAVVQIGRRDLSAIGLWSPLVIRERGRMMMVTPLDPNFTAADDAALRKVAIASWRREQDHPMVFSGIPDEAEAAAALTGARPEKFTLRPLAVANDAAVAGVLTLLIASQPRRYRRRQADRMHVEQAPLSHCPNCRYDLTGLTVDRHGDRTCPECGRVCGQFF